MLGAFENPWFHFANLYLTAAGLRPPLSAPALTKFHQTRHILNSEHLIITI